MNEDKITLDKEVFKTLASGTRVDILKSLDQRRKTLSELSRQLGMSVSTVKEHLDNLVSVGLIEQMDDGHKWKYYELTKKGKDILHPEDKKIWILIGVSALGIAVVGLDIIRSAFSTVMISTRGLGSDALKESTGGAAGDMLTAPPAERAPEALNLVAQFPYIFHVLGLLIFGIILLSCFIYITRRRRSINL